MAVFHSWFLDQFRFPLCRHSLWECERGRAEGHPEIAAGFHTGGHLPSIRCLKWPHIACWCWTFAVHCGMMVMVHSLLLVRRYKSRNLSQNKFLHKLGPSTLTPHWTVFPFNFFPFSFLHYCFFLIFMYFEYWTGGILYIESTFWIPDPTI